MGSTTSKYLFDDINEIIDESQQNMVSKENILYNVPKSKNIKKMKHKKKSNHTHMSFNVCVNKTHGKKFHNFIKFNEPTNVTIDALNQYKNIGIVKERIVNISLNANQYISIYDPFNETAFENPIQVGEIVYYGKKADSGYSVSFIDTHYETYIETH